MPAFGQPGPRLGVPWGSGLRRDPLERAEVQTCPDECERPDWKHAETVIPEGLDSIQYITKSKDFLFVLYSNGVVQRIVKYGMATGKSSEIKLPASGTVGISCPDWRSNRCIVSITSWTFPTTLYDFDAEKDTFAKSIFNTDVSYPGFENLITEEVEVPGHDGTMIPLSIIHKKGIPLDGSNSCILEGYGAYGISYTPYFNVRYSIALRGSCWHLLTPGWR